MRGGRGTRISSLSKLGMSRNRNRTESLGPGRIFWNGSGTRQGEVAGSCEHELYKMRGMSRLAEELSAS